MPQVSDLKSLYRMFMFVFLTSFLLLGGYFVSVSSALQPTCQVPSDAYATIQAALDDVNCDIIQIAEGTFFENISIIRNVTIVGAGEALTILDGGQKSHVVRVATATVTISDLTIQNGVTGPGIQSGEAAANNSGRAGAGVTNTGNLTLTNVTIARNSGTGIYNFQFSRLILESVTIVDNVVAPDRFNEGGDNISSRGDGIDNLGLASLHDVVIKRNFGIGIEASGSSQLSISSSTLSENGIDARDGGTSRGGGLVASGALSIDNSVISNNFSAGCGGGILLRQLTAGGIDQISLSRVIIRENEALRGGGVCLDTRGTFTSFTEVTLENNTADLGAAIFNLRTNLNLITSTIKNNTARESGGGIHNANNGTVTLTHSTMSGNEAFSGGAINNEANLFVINSMLHENVSEAGGAIFNSRNATLFNSTLSGNKAGTLGGALFNEPEGNVSMAFVTINGGSALAGGGIYNNGGALSIKNSLFGESQSGGNCAFSFTSEGYNLSSDSTCISSLSADTDQNEVDPLIDFQGLTNNGGITLTIALLAGSPAIDAIPIEACTDSEGIAVSADQRGVARPQGSACDIGAYEAEVE